jgi:transcriptional regulator NrdR family protein
MKCKKCNNACRTIDTRDPEAQETALTRRAKLFVPEEIPFRVRRHRCKSCKFTFDTAEIELSDIKRLKTIASSEKNK